MNCLLSGLRVIEAASFIAAPSGAVHLGQFGAEVIRIDPIGGGPDFHRWPLAPGGEHSLYWENLNQGKQSIAIHLGSPEGRELAVQLITAGGDGGGLFVTNYPATGFLGFESLQKRRSDLICVRIMGWSSGQTAVDYTVNAAVGVPDMTGPTGDPRPVNHVLPAWDLLAGSYAAFSLLAAERARRADGQGREIRIPLADLAMASLGFLGQIGEVQTQGTDRERMGNQLYGAFGRDFETREHGRVIVIAITVKQWRSLVGALQLQNDIRLLENQLGVRFETSEGTRFEYRDSLVPLFATAIGKLTQGEAAAVFTAHEVCWAPYRRLSQAVASGEFSTGPNALLSMVQHPSGHSYLTPAAPATIVGNTRRAPAAAPQLGRDTDRVLAEVLKLSAGEIGVLHDKGLVAGA